MAWRQSGAASDVCCSELFPLFRSSTPLHVWWFLVGSSLVFDENFIPPKAEHYTREVQRTFYIKKHVRQPTGAVWRLAHSHAADGVSVFCGCEYTVRPSISNCRHCSRTHNRKQRNHRGTMHFPQHFCLRWWSG